MMLLSPVVCSVCAGYHCPKPGHTRPKRNALDSSPRGVIVCSRAVSVCSPAVVRGLRGRAPLISHQQLVMFSFPLQMCRLSSALPAAAVQKGSAACASGTALHCWHGAAPSPAWGFGEHGDQRVKVNHTCLPLQTAGWLLEGRKRLPLSAVLESACVYATDNPRAFSQLGLSQQIESEASLASLLCFFLPSSLPSVKDVTA